MARTTGLWLLAILGISFAWALSHAAPEFTFEERVHAQESIERVHHAYRVGETRPFEQAVPRDLLERKVRRYLRQSAALDSFWKTPVTAEALQREVERMVAGTRMPERLRALYAALGDDPRLIQECLARPALVARLTESFFSRDRRIHAAAREEAEQLAGGLREGRIDPHAADPRRTVVDVEWDPGEFERHWTRVREQADAFFVEARLEQEPDRLRVARFSVAKTTFDEWWVETGFDSTTVPTVASSLDLLPLPAAGAGDGAVPCLADDTWDNGALDPPLPGARDDSTAVWTGNLFVVWGGNAGSQHYDTGGRYDPVTDTWSATSLDGAPDARSNHTAVWTGSEMIVWGGNVSSQYYDTGGRYDPVTDTWAPMSTTNAPTGRYWHTAVWAADVMVVWGGKAGIETLADGGRYDPATDTWTPMASGAPPARSRHTAVSTGSEMLFWGGLSTSSSPTNSGGRYNAATDTWGSMASSNFLDPRLGHVAVWTGSVMVVWGGLNSVPSYVYLDDGARYDPATNSWSPISTASAPSPRVYSEAVWTGSGMIVWGGEDPDKLDTGGRYDPVADTWTALDTTNAPQARARHVAGWTGTQMIVWGGSSSGGITQTGGRYDPMTDSWTPTAVSFPTGRYDHSAIWTGNEMVVWGGRDTFACLRSGGRYNPATDSWASVSTVDAPPVRCDHTAVWTGGEMIVWGGGSDYLDSGGRYEPLADTWMPTSRSGAPEGRRLHTAVWTGNEMIVWGGRGSADYLQTGGRYEPMSDTWLPTPMLDAPEARESPTGIWTGGEMIVWGGNHGFSPTFYLQTGGRYTPGAPAWTPTPLADAPQGRTSHTAVWTGSHMIVWGGEWGGQPLETGGVYNPVADNWKATVNTWPSRTQHAAVWTGNEMVVWGGLTPPGSSTLVNTGARYDPLDPEWIPTSTTNAPVARRNASAVWTGSFMMVWGGNGGSVMDSGGRYALGHAVDDDGDGFSECDGDCDDGNGALYFGPAEVEQLTVDGIAPTLIHFASQDGTSGLSTEYDVLIGDLAPLVANGDYAAASCLDSFPDTPAIDALASPASGSGRYYLVRARNACPIGGTGTYGDAGVGPDPRDDLDLTAPCP